MPVAAHAHFLWATADPAKGTFSVQFAEIPGDSVIPAIAGKGDLVKGFSRGGGTAALAVDGPGLKGKLSDGSAGAYLDYGVIERGSESRGKFLLRYSAKASSSPSASQIQVGLQLELSIIQRPEGPAVELHEGPRVVGGAEVSVFYAGQEKPFIGKTNDFGYMLLPSSPKVPIAFRSVLETMSPGVTSSGQYNFIRDYATLTIAGTGPVKADPAAYKALEQASKARETFPADVKSIEGKIAFLADGKTTEGTFVYKVGEGTKVSIEGKTGDSVRRQISSIFDHRKGGSFADGEGKNPITFADDEGLGGKRIALNDGLNSFYRVQDNQITEVDRSMGGQRFVITVLESQKTSGGKTLPKVFAVSYFDPNGPGLTQTQYFTDSFKKVNGVWLPATRRVVSAENGTMSISELRFDSLKVERSK